jgi:uncharacterized protein YhfF
MSAPATARIAEFGDSPELSEELIALIRSGAKRGAASLLWGHEADNEMVPQVGDIEVVVDHRREPVLVTRIVGVEVLAFIEVGAEFAAREGEGDGSLAHWRTAHWAFFSRECRRIGREPSEAMPVVCSSFEVLGMVP